MIDPIRIRAANEAPARPDAAYVLYWMIGARRLAHNVALEHAAALAQEWRKPLVIFEPLRVGYQWANDRLHAFVLEGIAEHERVLAQRGVPYLPYIERRAGDGRGLLAALAGDACAVVTDDYPAFFLPRMVAAAAAQLERAGIRLDAVDSNGLLPMRAETKCFLTAYSFRAQMQRRLRDAIRAWPAADPLKHVTADGLPAAMTAITRTLGRGGDRWRMATRQELATPAALAASLPIDHAVTPVSMRGGTAAATEALQRFVHDGLQRYTDDRNQPSLRGTSRLSPYLHFGHIGAHDVFSAVMTREQWTTRKLAATGGGAREGWWGASAGAEAFLDQLVTWRELGFNMCVTRPDDYATYASLPAWARATLDAHASDPRRYVYSRAEFASASTHDAMWNAAQRELLRDGWMHNYLRMLWGKKILEWSPTPADALDTMIDIMNRHALDGRDPNSYTGYGWVLGRYDRPWAPERPIFGTIRYMSSDSTLKKLRMKPYLATYGPDESPRLL